MVKPLFSTSLVALAGSSSMMFVPDKAMVLLTVRMPTAFKPPKTPGETVGPATYTGDTTLNSGALRLQGAADISTSTNITINAGSTLIVTGMVNSTFTLVSGHTLSGNGVVNGKLIANAGSTVSPGVLGGLNAVGILTVSNTIALSGTNIMELDPDNATNDVLKSGSSITYGGTLSLVDLSSPLSGGSSFKLFSASSYLGSFANITPATPGAGLAWDTSALGTTGTIKVVTTT